MSSLFKSINKFGLYGGLNAFLSIKFRRKSFTLPGKKNVINLRNKFSDRYTFKETFFRGQYEIGNIIENPKLIVDAGANIGISTIFFADKYPTAKVFAIEPDPENFKMTKLNTSSFENVEVFNGGVWYKKVKLQVVDQDLGTRGYTTSEVYEDGNFNQTVQAITISGILNSENAKHIDILKMDIEGSEKEVFSGSYEDWLPCTKVLIIELHDRMNSGCSKSFFSALSKYHFSLYKILDENLVFINDDFIKINDKMDHLI